jgi:hypothetical protein
MTRVLSSPNAFVANLKMPVKNRPAKPLAQALSLLTFGSDPAIDAQMSGRELQKLMRQKGMKVQVCVAALEDKPGEYQLFVLLSRPDTPVQAQEALAALTQDGLVQRTPLGFVYEGLPVKLSGQTGIEMLSVKAQWGSANNQDTFEKIN